MPRWVNKVNWCNVQTLRHEVQVSIILYRLSYPWCQNALLQRARDSQDGGIVSVIRPPISKCQLRIAVRWYNFFLLSSHNWIKYAHINIELILKKNIIEITLLGVNTNCIRAVLNKIKMSVDNIKTKRTQKTANKN